MNFKQFSDSVNNRLSELSKTGKLFRSSVTGDQLWDIYLSSFKKGDDPVFRDPESTTHTCKLDSQFIKRYGNIVALTPSYEIINLWDIKLPEDSIYYQPAIKMSETLVSNPIKDVFFESFYELDRNLNYGKVNKKDTTFRLGIESNHKHYTQEEVNKYGVVEFGKAYQFNHFYADLITYFVHKGTESLATVLAKYRDDQSVFYRGLREIPLDVLELVKDLINQGSLLDGTSHLYKIEQIIPLKQEYDKLSSKQQENWSWVKSYGLPFARFRGELIGTLCADIAQGVDLNEACQTWNKRVDPANYMKAKSPITQAQINDAKRFVEENGYGDSFNRRLAVLDDINVEEILHTNIGNGKIKTASIFDGIKSAPTKAKKAKFDTVEEITIDRFMQDILPSCTEIEAFVENRMQNNFVAITSSIDKNAKKPFKWDNPFSWTYNGNLAGKSQLAERVLEKGGRVDGAFRFTHSWNEIEPNASLMDLHVFMPDCQIPAQNTGGPNVRGRRVGWNFRNDALSGGIQDVDYTSPAPSGYIPVENITFPDIKRMPEGKYTCMIHNWQFRSTGGQGKAEIAFDGQVFEYIYPKTTRHEWVKIAEVTLKDGTFTIEHSLPLASSSSKEVWNIKTGEFHKVNLACLSPNHWGNNNTGNKHYFFMLDGCKSDSPLRGFHSENLNSDLVKHRKVMEVLGMTNMIQPDKEHLAGLGFNSTVNDELVVKVNGTHKRTLKIKF